MNFYKCCLTVHFNKYFLNMASFNMAANGNAGINRKRREHEYSYQMDDFSQNSFDNSHKKVKMEQGIDEKPSRVIHIRNVPQEVDDTSVAMLAVPFGYIDNIVFVRKNNQALIQMRELNEAIEMADYFNQYVPLMYGKHLFIQFSKHQQLDLRNNNSNIDKLVQSANEKRKHYLINWANNTGGASEILRILIDNAPNLIINHLVFYKIFSRFGQIIRIVSFTKNNQHHGLVEFASTLSSHVAQLQLNGANLLGDCGTMRIDFSKNPGPLQVQRQSDKVRDYMESPLNRTELQELEGPQYSFPLFAVGRSMSMARGNDQQFMSNITAQLSAMASQTGVELTPAAAMAAASLMAACNQMNHRTADQSNWGFGSNQSQNAMFNPNSGIENGNSVVLVTNLNAEKSNPDALFTLFGVYGDVMRVKVMFNKKNTALVQFANHQQAMTAIRNLDACFLWGKQMHLHVSKTNVIQLPMEDANHGLTKDYSISTLHRFKKPNSKNYQNIFPPSAVVHLSNIPPTTSEGDLSDMIRIAGYEVKKFKFLPNDKKMALLELNSVEDAIHVLIEFHNRKLSEKNHLRISFSKAGAF